MDAEPTPVPGMFAVGTGRADAVDLISFQAVGSDAQLAELLDLAHGAYQVSIRVERRRSAAAVAIAPPTISQSAATTTSTFTEKEV